MVVIVDYGMGNVDDLIDDEGYWRNPTENLADDPGYCVIC